MRPRRAAVLAVPAVLATLVLSLGVAGPAARAQDGGSEVPTQDIIPEPGSGEEPEEAGDRGGSLQLAVLGLVVVAIVGGAAYVAQRARGYSSTSARMASQADTPSMKPER